MSRVTFRKIMQVLQQRDALSFCVLVRIPNQSKVQSVEGRKLNVGWLIGFFVVFDVDASAISHRVRHPSRVHSSGMDAP